jgi:oxygen-independent coproporphyrinogen III oxidase
MIPFLPQYVESLCQEQIVVSQAADAQIPVGTIFFGGGTPSLLSAKDFEIILRTASDNFKLMDSVEITIEANPGTVNADYLKSIHSLGINRISFGMQSAHPGDLQTLNRQHVQRDVIQAVEWSKKAGFNHINLDLIFGIPGQDIQRWLSTLELALMENIDHFSLYSLSVEEGTPLKKWIDHGLIPAPDEDLAADMYESAIDKFEQAGFLQYEISNWTRLDGQDNRCLHNLQYWRYLPYLGFGAGAHGFFNDTRTENAGGIAEYITRMKGGVRTGFPAGPACLQSQRLSKWDQMQEYLMVGYRLTDEGISKLEFQQQFGHPIEEYFPKQLDHLANQGLIEVHPQDPSRLRLTRRGRLFGNRVFTEFVGNRIPKGFEAN